MTFGALCNLLDELRATRRRTKKVELVAAFLAALAPSERKAAVAFLSGRAFPAADPRTLDASGALLREAAGGKRDRRGTPAPEHPSLPFEAPPEDPSASASDGPLSLDDVRRAFDEVAAASGPRSRRRKLVALGALFRRSSERERDALFAIVQGSLRTGVHEGLLLEAVAKAAAVTSDSVRRATLFLGDPADVAAIALEGGADALAAVRLTPFVPVRPMLAEPAADIAEAWETLAGTLALEVKYDGVRLQLHKKGDHVRAWSRRLTEMTTSLPEVVAIGRSLSAQEAILDGEVLGRDADGRPVPFQETMGRIFRDPDGAASSVPLLFRFFDCLLVDGTMLVDEPYPVRRAALERIAPAEHLAERELPESVADASAMLARALAAGQEGVIAKALDGAYEPGRRGKKWLKIKVADTIDCVIVAADRGSGRREGWLSNHHLGVRQEEGGWAAVGKTFKGLTDAEHVAMTGRLRALATDDDGYTVTVRPEIVVEVAYDGIQKSPHLSSGLALRFARITRIRDDKRPEDATTLAELRARFDRQRATRSGDVEG